MEPLESLNLRTDECSFLETVIADVRRYVNNSIPKKKKIVLVFPPLNSRKRFLVHSLIQNYFEDLKTLSIGNSFGRRNVVYHSSLGSMINNAKMESLENYSDNCSTNMAAKLYKTPRERKAQEKLLRSLKPNDKDSTTRFAQRKINKRPDIPIYVPKQRREPTNNSFNNCVSELPACIIKNVSKTNQKDINTSGIQLDRNDEFSPTPNCQKNSSNSNLVNKTFETTNELVNQIPESLQSHCHYSTNKALNRSLPLIPDEKLLSSNENEQSFCKQFVDECKLDTFLENDSMKANVSKLDVKKANIYGDSCSIVSHNISDLIDLECDKLPLNNVKEEIECCKFSSTLQVDEVLNKLETEPTGIKDDVEKFDIENNCDDTTVLTIEHENFCPNFLFDDSLNNKSMSGDMNNDAINSLMENSVEIVDEQNLEKEKISSVIEKNCLSETQSQKKKKKKKKKVLDVEECSWEDLFDKEDEYIHPLLMKELVTTMGNVQVKRTEEDYRSYQTTEERTGDGECVIEVYGFSSQLKTVDLMNQFSAFRRKHFDIVWVDDTHALAVFESPNFADRALNTSFALVKTRPLKDAIKESKLKAQTIAPLPVTRPKTCSAMARRLVSSALGLKLNVSPEMLNAERTMLANAKEKKIRDAQQKNKIWDENV